MNIESLKEVLGECKRPTTSKCPVPSSFEMLSLSDFYIFDDKVEDKEPVRVVTENDDYQLIVRNKTPQEICLVKTDKCLFTNDHSKCDCILFNKNKCFLVEIKKGGSGTRGNLRRKAVEQLGLTINLLLNNKIVLSAHETKAVICFKSGITRPTQASSNTKRAVFLENYNISLEEGNEIVF